MVDIIDNVCLFFYFNTSPTEYANFNFRYIFLMTRVKPKTPRTLKTPIKTKLVRKKKKNRKTLMFSFTGKSFLSLITFEIQEKQLKIHFLGGGGGGGGRSLEGMYI